MKTVKIAARFGPERVPCFGHLNGLAVTPSVEPLIGGECGYVLTHVASGRAMFRSPSKTLTMLALDTVAPLWDWTRGMEAIVMSMAREGVGDFFGLLLEDIGDGERGVNPPLDPEGRRVYERAAAKYGTGALP